MAPYLVLHIFVGCGLFRVEKTHCAHVRAAQVASSRWMTAPFKTLDAGAVRGQIEGWYNEALGARAAQCRLMCCGLA